MRHLFDQYDGPENRLTHALACCLKEDPRLLRSFVKWAGVRKVPQAQQMEIVEQRIPGQLEDSEFLLEKRGLPDIWIHDKDKWCLLVENKVTSPLTADQLRRHVETARSHGFQDISLLTITLGSLSKKRHPEATHCTWPKLYEWLITKHVRVDWAQRMTEYMEIAEGRMIDSGYLKEGTLTMFSGIKYDPTDPYNYTNTKRVLKLAMDELRTNKKLIKMGADPQGKGRSAITGSKGLGVWDYIPLKQSRGTASFTSFPHLTFSINANHIDAAITIPNGIKPAYRNNVRNLKMDGFVELIDQITTELDKCFKDIDGARPWVYVCQRHYKSQRSQGIADARLEFDPRTSLDGHLETSGKKPSVKHQPQWVAATYDAFANKKSNLQVGIGGRFSRDCKRMHSSSALDLISGTWLACKPLLDVMFNKT
jgi:hypothetical protein